MKILMYIFSLLFMYLLRISWEQRKLGDVYSERNERGNVELDILSVSIHHGISQNELDTDELGKSVRRSDDKSLYKHGSSGVPVGKIRGRNAR